ncbi:hypothetical protein DXX94_15020 [Thalassotalea euphylliae]|uniref:Uncharacterized protein n=1 Tax=Thalassotalea euphylliae TaxID=1655234 RepID=A0A3E0U7N1_9GAMM|nr:hypothetical protein DXX94_15020 [Thalassotalea euphylliae]
MISYNYFGAKKSQIQPNGKYLRMIISISTHLLSIRISLFKSVGKASANRIDSRMLASEKLATKKLVAKK